MVEATGTRDEGPPGGRHRVVVVGGGFGGMNAVRALRSAPADVTLIDQRNFHLFQPLLYQVATGALSPGEIAYPLRSIFKRQEHVRVLLGRVEDVDLEGRHVVMQPEGEGESTLAVPYDTLIVAAGSRHGYFGHDEWERYAPGLKSIEDATNLRSRILAAFESAELEADPERRRAWLTFVVVGGGPTGAEMAGQIAEIAHDTLRRDFRTIDPTESEVLLIDAGDRILAGFHPALSRHAVDQLRELGVESRVDRLVTAVDEHGVTTKGPDGREERIEARTIVWAAGVFASPLGRRLAEQAGVEADRVGRVPVLPDLTLPGHPEVMVVGDMALLHDEHGRELPGVAPTAMQEGTYAGRAAARRAAGRAPQAPFRYVDKGNLATIGRAKGIADIKGLRFWGLPAWLLWLLVHITYLIGFQNRLLVLMRWAYSFLTRGRGARLITGANAAPVRRARTPGR